MIHPIKKQNYSKSAKEDKIPSAIVVVNVIYLVINKQLL